PKTRKGASSLDPKCSAFLLKKYMSYTLYTALTVMRLKMQVLLRADGIRPYKVKSTQTRQGQEHTDPQGQEHTDPQGQEHTDPARARAHRPGKVKTLQCLAVAKASEEQCGRNVWIRLSSS
ncbi:MAG: hypothetical protein RR873_00995, partial [Christensenella sp.]